MIAYSFYRFVKMKTVGPRVIANLRFLKRLARSTSEKQRWRILRDASCDELLSLVEICTNVLNSNFCLTQRQKEKLKPFAVLVRQISRVRSESGARQIVQKGNGFFFGSLLLPIITEAARYLLTKYKDG